jgi:hypothetical protein
MADGLFYRDMREPFISGDGGDITLATTDKALYTPSMFPVLGGQYFSRPGKKLHIRLFGKITTAATPGNGVFDIYYGDGTDANGVLLASSLSTTALSASQTTKSWTLDLYVHCRTTGSTGTLFVTGIAFFSNLVVATTAQPVMLPPDTAVVSGACDLTAAKIISVQFKRSGSTAEHMWVQDMEVTAEN